MLSAFLVIVGILILAKWASPLTSLTTTVRAKDMYEDAEGIRCYY